MVPGAFLGILGAFQTMFLQCPGDALGVAGENFISESTPDSLVQLAQIWARSGLEDWGGYNSTPQKVQEPSRVV